jgi:hypothetical protein
MLWDEDCDLTTVEGDDGEQVYSCMEGVRMEGRCSDGLSRDLFVQSSGAHYMNIRPTFSVPFARS